MLVNYLVLGIRAARVGLAVIPLALALLASSATHARAQAPAAQAQVHEALYQEIYGRNHQRQQQLEAALATDPNLAAARWQLGHVKIDQQWQPVEQVIAGYQNDPLLAEYAQRRAAMPDNPGAHRDLALWCDSNHLYDRERYHWQQVLAQLPTNEQARRALQLFYNESGQLITREEYIAQQELDRQWRVADTQWRRTLTRYRYLILNGSPAKREEALTAIAALDDEWCLPTLEDIFSREGGELALVALSGIANIQHPWATQSLLRHALLSEDARVRRVATLALKERPLHEVVPVLIGALQTPYEIAFQEIGNPPHELVLRMEVRRETPHTTYVTSIDLPIYEESDFAANRQRMEVALAASNSLFTEGNQRLAAVLAEVSGQPAELTVRQWSDWWQEYNVLEHHEPQEEPFALQDQVMAVLRSEVAHLERMASLAFGSRGLVVGYNEAAGMHQHYVAGEFSNDPLSHRYIVGRYTIEPAFSSNFGTLIDGRLTNSLDDVPIGAYVYDSKALGWKMFNYAGDGRLTANMSCFAAGTPVWTDQGQKPIEEILPGDRVLTQDVETGELTFTLVTACTVREPTEVFSVIAGGETIVASGGHPFWVSGQGWRMVRELQSGDALHGLAGAYLLSDVIAQDEPQAVYNLVVEENHNYFVGDSQLLVHDVTLRAPTQAIVPGLVGSP